MLELGGSTPATHQLGTWQRATSYRGARGARSDPDVREHEACSQEPRIPSRDLPCSIGRSCRRPQGATRDARPRGTPAKKLQPTIAKGPFRCRPSQPRLPPSRANLSSEPWLHQRGVEIQAFGTCAIPGRPVGEDAALFVSAAQSAPGQLADSGRPVQEETMADAGATFYQLHLLLDKHAGKQSSDRPIAERVQTLWGVAVAIRATSPRPCVCRAPRTAARRCRRCLPPARGAEPSHQRHDAAARVADRRRGNERIDHLPGAGRRVAGLVPRGAPGRHALVRA